MMGNLMSAATALTVPHYAGMAVVVFAAALLQGMGGVGFAMVSAPLSLLFFPELAPGPLLLLGAALAALGAVREWQAIDWPDTAALMSGRLVGSFAAGALLVVLPADGFAILFAVIILVGVGFSFAGWRVKATRPAMVVAGVASGLMGTITSSGAPPIAIVMQNMPAARLRATVSSFFVLGALLSLGILYSVGRFGMTECGLGLILAPAMMLGFLASGPAKGHLSQAHLRIGLLLMSATGAIAILLRTLVALVA
ncbi:MAG: hypothetical protein H6Q99_2155 [Proteobacteria bacterium]|nr:hypothetical protein [Pseudomonadota bacterium]